MTAAGQAPGKVILVGEHAVVYGRPAIAVPVWETRASATVTSLAPGSGCTIRAGDIGLEFMLAGAAEEEPLALVTRLALQYLALDGDPDWLIEVRSDIPIASGMGSGAAVSAAIVRAIFRYAGFEPTPKVVSDLVYAGEEIHHGTPSGIDNTVVAYGAPVWFVRGKAPQVFDASRMFTLAIADSGAAASTREMVGGVRRRRETAPQLYDAWFDEMGAIALAAREAMETGDVQGLGALFDRNQALLQQIGVSTPTLERLVSAALAAGAAGAKLSGAGGGGNVIALVTEEMRPAVTDTLLAAGARRVIVSTVGGPRSG